MELEEMKTIWETLSKKMENQEKLTKQMMEKMTQQKYRSKLNKIAYPEYTGTIICYIGAAYLMMNFTRINHPLIQLFSIVAMLLLFILPIISLRSIRGMRNLDISTKTYSEAIRDYAHQKIRFQKFQKLNVALGMFLILICPPVLADMYGKDLHSVPHFWTLILPMGLAIFIVLALWVLGCYNKTLKEAENELSEVDN